ncbi:hypothetical protein [Ferruginibacter sp.]|nr:hypothetical protein [Ferruginibacter sp.]
MTSKEAFLNRILEQIQTLQSAYEFNKGLPDSLFDSLPSASNSIQKNILHNHPSLTSIQINKPSANVQRINTIKSPAASAYGQQQDYGINKRTLIQILHDEGKAMVKWNIQTRFAEMLGKTTDEVLNTVTNTIATLKEDGTIIGYKPQGLKFKGQFWGLSEWYENGIIKEQYSPFKGVTIL